MIDRPLQTQYFLGLLLWYRIHIFCLTTFLILRFSLFNFCNTNIISKELVWDLIAFHEPATACKFTRKTSIFSFFINGLYIDILTLHIPKGTGAFYPKKYIQYSRGGFFRIRLFSTMSTYDLAIIFIFSNHTSECPMNWIS